MPTRSVAQSALGIIVLLSGCMASGLWLMNTALITHIRETFYRETASNTYSGGLFPLAYFIAEMPYLAFLSLEVCTPCEAVYAIGVRLGVQ